LTAAGLMAEAQRTIGRFEILGRVGRGGMTTVYLARQSGLDRRVALKELASADPEDAPAFAERFLLQIVSNSSASASFHVRTVVVACPVGTRVIGTGAQIQFADGDVVLNHVFPRGNGTEVEAQAIEGPSNPTTNWVLATYALCATVS
jgi:serine/threonine protein kinase